MREAPEEPSTVAERLAAVDDLFETAIAMRRARFLRENPRATTADADAAVQACVLESEDDRGGSLRPMSGAKLRAFLERTGAR